MSDERDNQISPPPKHGPASLHSWASQDLTQTCDRNGMVGLAVQQCFSLARKSNILLIVVIPVFMFLMKDKRVSSEVAFRLLCLGVQIH